jgi:hypothetical protein
MNALIDARRFSYTGKGRNIGRLQIEYRKTGDRLPYKNNPHKNDAAVEKVDASMNNGDGCVAASACNY